MEKLKRCTGFWIRLYSQPSNSNQASEQMEKLERCRVYGTSVCYINQNKANVKTLQEKSAFRILGASKSFKN